jgi:hypothetical protein
MGWSRPREREVQLRGLVAHDHLDGPAGAGVLRGPAYQRELGSRPQVAQLPGAGEQQVAVVQADGAVEQEENVT